MNAFLILAGVMIALALAFVLPALLRKNRDEEEANRARANILIYRDQLAELDAELKNGEIAAEQHEAGRREIERRVLEDTLAALNEAPPESRARMKWLPIALSVILPLAALGLYLKIGTPQTVMPQTAAEDSGAENGQAPHGMSFDKIREMAAKLADHLKQNPDDGEGWAMLGRSYRVLGQFGEASDAYQHAAKLIPNDAQLLADYADALAMSQGQSLSGEPTRLVEQALKIDPKNLKALALAGTAAFDAKNFKSAVDYWQRAVKVAPPDSDFTQSLQSGIQEAQARLEGKVPPMETPTIMPQQPSQAEAGSPSGAAAVISGKVSLSPSLASRVSPNDTLFIFARAAGGPPMPLAILRLKASDLPASFKLDDSSAMSPSMKLSDFSKVLVTARISKSGNAMPQSGDLEGSIGPIDNNASSVKLQIDRAVP